MGEIALWLCFVGTAGLLGAAIYLSVRNTANFFPAGLVLCISGLFGLVVGLVGSSRMHSTDHLVHSVNEIRSELETMRFVPPVWASLNIGGCDIPLFGDRVSNGSEHLAATGNNALVLMLRSQHCAVNADYRLLQYIREILERQQSSDPEVKQNIGEALTAMSTARKKIHTAYQIVAN